MIKWLAINNPNVYFVIGALLGRYVFREWLTDRADLLFPVDINSYRVPYYWKFVSDQTKRYNFPFFLYIVIVEYAFFSTVFLEEKTLA